MPISKAKFTFSVLALTFINYSIAYLLSSREFLFDYKNISLIFFFTIIWSFFYHRLPKTPITILYIVSCILGFTVPALAYFSEPTFLQRLMKDFLFWYSFPLVLITPVTWISTRKPLLYVATIISIVAAIPLTSIILYYLIFNTQLSTDSMLATLQTNKQESLEFFTTYVTTTHILAGIIITSISIYITFKLYSNLFSTKLCPPRLYKRKFFIAFNIILLLSCTMFAQKTYFARCLSSAITRNNSINNFSVYSKNRIQKLSQDAVLKSDTENNSFALIIGETHARSNMSAYGYQRNTTPWLTSAAKNQDVILLKNSFSNSGVTTPSLEYALTSRNQYNNTAYENAVTITEIAQASGFNVIWISNQIDDNIAGMIGHEANEQYWLNKKHNDTWMRQKNNSFDEQILQCLEKLSPPKEKTLFVINLLGSHASYDCRYPESFNKWDESNSLLNAYDNSILYNDYVMSQIYELLFRKFNIDAMMYFSDHGEELKLKFCHGNEYFYENYKTHPSVKEIVKIPTYFAFSESYKEKHPELINALTANSQKYFTNDMVYDTMLGIMHIPAPYHDSIYDITSSNYNMSLDGLKTLHGKVNIKDCL